MTGTGRQSAAAIVPRHVIDRARSRILVGGVVVFAAFLAVGLRLADLTLLHGDDPALAAIDSGGAADAGGRADIVDRDGRLLATSLATASLYADARVVREPAKAAAELASLLPDLDRAKTAALLASNRPFVWIRRALTPRQEYEVNRLGIPGLDFKREERRVYPMGSLAAHVLGFTDVDGHGIAGVEMALGKTLRADDGPLRLSIDARIQNVMAEALSRAVDEFHAVGAAGIVMNVRNGEVVALASVPTYDPNRPGDISKDALFNRATLGVYEMGSTFKVMTLAMALDDGVATLASSYDATKPIHVARFTINDYHAERRWLTLPEIFAHSSNIGAARIALAVGGTAQQAFLRKIGMLGVSPIELPEVGRPLVPDRWGEIATMTVGFGHGISVTPIQLASAVSAVVNGGILYPPTILRRPEGRDAGRAAGRLAAHLGRDAQAVPPGRHRRHGFVCRRARLRRRRQDGDGREGRRAPLRAALAAVLLRRRVPDERSPLRRARHRRRTARHQEDSWLCHRWLGRGAGGARGGGAHGADGGYPARRSQLAGRRRPAPRPPSRARPRSRAWARSRARPRDRSTPRCV